MKIGPKINSRLSDAKVGYLRSHIDLNYYIRHQHDVVVAPYGGTKLKTILFSQYFDFN